MFSDHPGLLIAGFFFCLALFFFLMCAGVGVEGQDARVLAFWYAVIFEFAGYLTLAVHTVTS